MPDVNARALGPLPQPESGFVPDHAGYLNFRAGPDAQTALLGILLGADSLSTNRSGIGRVTLEIARELEQHEEIGDFRLLMRGRAHRASPLLDRLAVEDGHRCTAGAAESPYAAAYRKVRAQLRRVSSIRRLRDMKLRLDMMREVQQLRAQMNGQIVYYEPNFIAHPFDGPTVVEVNDLSWLHEPDCHPAERITWIDQNLARTLRQAQRFVAISEFTAAGLSKDLGVSRSLIDVVPLAPSALFRPVDEHDAGSTLAHYGVQDRRFILSVSTLEPRKNFDRLVLAHSQLPRSLRTRFPLAIAGGSGWGQVLDSTVAQRALEEGDLRLLGHVPDRDLVCLMARCAAFPYVSLYEGFGLPVIEAMASGAPVIASETTAVGEIAQAAAICVNPLDEVAICEAMRTMLEDTLAAERYRWLGLAHAAGFSWRRTVDNLIDSWRMALSA